MMRWPAPYRVRYEAGAEAWLARMEKRIGGRLAVFDHYPYSVPLAALGRSRVLGLSEFSFGALQHLSEWIADRAVREEVLWVTAFDNPGIENGVVLEFMDRETILLTRARAKYALPAVRETRTVDVNVLRARPVGADEFPVMDKVFVRRQKEMKGVLGLGLRPPWGRDAAIEMTDGSRLAATWSRDGSGILGPAPRPGGAVRITVEAAANRSDGEDRQILEFVPPWNGDGLKLYVSNGYTKVSGILVRPQSQADDGKRIGLYTIGAGIPYSPREAGLRGFADDLGALIHRIRIEPVTDPSP